jgi:hypothetical protein
VTEGETKKQLRVRDKKINGDEKSKAEALKKAKKSTHLWSHTKQLLKE